LGYDAVLIIVIAELVFAFGVGVGCVLFSFNLVKTVYKSEENALQVGQFPLSPPRENMLNPILSRIPSLFSNDQPLDDEEVGRSYSIFSADNASREEGKTTSLGEEDKPITEFAAILKSFTDYIRFY
jgi:hypothetical protein